MDSSPPISPNHPNSQESFVTADRAQEYRPNLAIHLNGTSTSSQPLFDLDDDSADSIATTSFLHDAYNEENGEEVEEKRDDSQEKLDTPDIEFPTTIDSVLVQRAFDALKKENAKLKSKLDLSQRSAILMKPRYEYLESHYTEYVRMREEYRRLTEEHDPDDKEAAATAAALSEVRREACSKETQTWKGIVCSYCTKTFEITNNKIFKDFVEWQTKTAFCVSRKAHEELVDRFDKVVEAIKVRETIFENRTERAAIINLKTEVSKLKCQIAQLLRKNKHGQHCLETLQRIVIKLVADESDPGIDKISEQEQLWIDRILQKCPLLMAAADNPEVNLSPSSIDFSRPQRTMSCTHPLADSSTAAGDF